MLVRESDDLCDMSTGVEDAPIQVGSAGIYPNPVAPGARINFSAPAEGPLQFVGANGQELASVVLPPGTMGMDLPKVLGRGVYALRMSGRPVERVVVE